MQQIIPAKVLRVLISEADRLANKPLYEAIVAKCHEMKIAGATVFRGVEGYGETGEMHKAHLVHPDRPILITIVDTVDNIEHITPVIEQMMKTGVIAKSDVNMIRVRGGKTAEGGGTK